MAEKSISPLVSVVLILIALVVVVGGVAIVTLSGRSKPPEDAHRVTAGEAVTLTEPAPSTTNAVAGEPAVYTLTDESVIGWTGYKIVGQHSGEFLLYEGTVNLTDGTIGSARADVLIETSSCLTDNDTLTKVVMNDQFFDVNNYPEAEFTVTSIDESNSQYWVAGNLTLRDVTRSIRYPADIALTEDGMMTIDAEFTVNRRDWGIIYDGIGDNVLKDEVLISLDVEAEREDGGEG